MATNTNTHYLLAKSQHKATLRRTRRRYDQLVVHATVALEEAALNFMGSNPRIRCCCIAMGTVGFFYGEEPIGEVVPGGTLCYPKALAVKVASFERDFVEPFVQMFGPTFRPFRIDRDAKGKLVTRRDW